MTKVEIKLRELERRLIIVEACGREGLPPQNADGHTCQAPLCTAQLGSKDLEFFPHSPECIYRKLGEFDAETERQRRSCDTCKHQGFGATFVSKYCTLGQEKARCCKKEGLSKWEEKQ